MDADIKRKTHIKGLMGELAFTYRMIEKGWKVFTPLDQNSRIDMILDIGGKLLKIQIKYCTPYRGCLRIDLERRFRKTNHFTMDDLDAVGVFDAVNSKCYLIPFDKIHPHQGIWLRVQKSMNKQQKGIHWAGEYEI